MAQSKNNFIKSRMNKDLDDRLIPNGEYRDALNISISQAEDQNVGTVSTVLGNVKLTDFGLTSNCEAKIIGVFADETNKSVFVFITNFIDTSFNKLNNFPSDNAICQIWQRNIETNINTKLVEGKFLNFAINNPILNINLIEDLLFFTDNRNQPRKINITKANPGGLIAPVYYTNEDQISVAKYYPCDPISLLNNYVTYFTISATGGSGDPLNPNFYSQLVGEIVPTTVVGSSNGSGMLIKIISATSDGGILNVEIVNQGTNYSNGDVVNVAPKSGTAQITLAVEEQSTMKDKCTELLPVTAIANKASGTTLTSGASYATNVPGSYTYLLPFLNCLVSIKDSAGLDITPLGAKITTLTSGGGGIANVTISWIPSGETLTGVSTITAGRNPDYDPNWPGDCEFLKDKFVRFAYRFKFDDNEYSLISPFTQPCFIPKQNGYFISNNQQEAYETTELTFFENSVNSVGLKIFCPEFLDSSTNNFSSLNEKMHIEAIDIIYKEDSETALKIVDTIQLEDFVNLNQNFLLYDYQSRAPFRVLPEREIIRVSDVVPLRSLTQEVSGNRVIYGNYTDGHTSNSTLNYSVASSEKFDESISTLKKEYQNHTLKQNRTYQVGVVLSDRYGRQSDVILSSLDNSTQTTGAVNYYGSTIFHPFYSSGFSTRLVSSGGTWGGDSLQIQFNSLIPENTGQVGYPGLFRGTLSSDIISNLYPGSGYTSSTNIATTGGTGTGLTVDFITFKPTIASYIVSVTINQPGSGYLNGDVITINDPANSQPSSGTNYATFIYKAGQNPNLTGWYSYKVVVKQDEQEYYNVYLPGILNNEINSDGSTNSTKATLSLFADNVNKIPQDLTDVGPTQSSFNSSEKLSIRVNNNSSTANEQFYPGTSTEDVINLSELSSLGFNLNRQSQGVRSNAGSGVTEILLTGFLNDIQPGSAITGVTNTGANVADLTLSDGYYVKAYVSDNTTDSKIILNKALGSSGVTTTDVISFSPPGVVFNSNNNPIVGSLSTTSSIGVSADNNFATILAVAETSPVKSNLNIFYETSTSGKISELNPAITIGSPVTSIGSITGIQFSLNENAGSGVISVTNNFNPLNLNNQNVIDVNATGEIINVVDGNNTQRPNLFTLNNNNGNFSISKNSGVSFFVGNDSNATNFIFTIKLSLDNVDVFETFQGIISNTQPSFTPTPTLLTAPNDTYALPILFDNIPQPLRSQIIPSNTGPIQILKGLNGSSDTALQDKDLTWEITSIKCIDGDNIPADVNQIALVTGLDPYSFNPSNPDYDEDAANLVTQTLLNQYEQNKVYFPAKADGSPDTNKRGSDNWKILQNQELITTPYSGSNFSFADSTLIQIVGGTATALGYQAGVDSVGIIAPGLAGNSQSYSVDLDGQPNFFQSYINFFNQNNPVNNPAQDVNFDALVFLAFATFQVTIQLKDGAGAALQDDIVLKIKYT
jgi:hypothetical protein